MTSDGLPADHDGLPQLSVARLARLIREAVHTVELDLSGAVVLTEAATGAYAVTPVIAALAGALRVTALTQDSRFGTVAQVTEQTNALAEAVGVRDRITITSTRDLDLFAEADIVTNSAHVRPIDATVAAAMLPGTALPLMFEAWEIQAGRVDLDLDALSERGVLIAGTNERHPLIDVFSYLGLLAIVQLADAGVPALGSRIGLLCDNPFIESMTAGLASAGATVFSGSTLEHLVVNAPLDAVIVAMTPTGRPLIAAAEAAIVVDTDPAMTIVQFWGDIDRVALEQKSISYWPRFDPGTGHMGGTALSGRTRTDREVTNRRIESRTSASHRAG